MNGLLLIFALFLATASLGAASANQRPVLDYLIQLAASECTQAGQAICSEDSSMVILCVSNGQGFDAVRLETCSASTKCSAEHGRCVRDNASGGSTGHPIECHGRAMLPDPFNCTVYHVCLSGDIYSLPQACNDGYAYNPLTSDCSNQMTDSVCTDGPVPACYNVGQSGPLATNPSIYYICTSSDCTLTPQLYKCKHGLKFDSTTFSCVELRSSTASEDTGEPTTPTTTTAGPPTLGAYCSTPQVRVFDPEDCTKFYECSPVNTWLHVTCIPDYYFNTENNRCEVGIC